MTPSTLARRGSARPGPARYAEGRAGTSRLFTGLLAVAAACLTGVSARAQTVDNWTSTSSSSWGTAGNWSVGIPASAYAATFNNSSGLDTSITLLAASSTGTLVFLSTGGANAYTFDTAGTQNTNTLTIASGITNSDTAALTFYNTTTLGGSQSWTNNGGTMAFNGNVNLGSGTTGYALTIAGSGPVNISGIIANGGTGAGSLEYSGTGTLTLTGANTYTGGTTIDSGANLQLGNGTTNGTVASTSGITDNGTLLLDEGSAVTVGKVISGTGGITQNGSSNTTLSGTNTYSGATTINSGTLTAGSASALGGATGLSAVTVNGSGVLAIAAGDSNTVGSIDSSSATGSITIGSIATTLTSGGNNTSTTFAGVISGAGNLTEAGTGTLTLNNADTYTGKTTINAGASLQLGDGTNNGTIASTSGITDNGTLLFDEGSAVTVGKVISGAGGVTQNGSSNTTLSGTNTYSGATTINSGTLTAGSASAFGGATGHSAVTINNSGVLALTAGDSNTVGSVASGSATSSITIGSSATTLTTGGNNTSTTFAGVISGAGNLTEAGTGTLTLNNADTYAGKTTINAGASLQLGDGTTNGTIASTSGIADKGTLILDEGTGVTISTAITSTGAVTQNGSVNNTLSGTNTYSGATTVNGGTLTAGSASAFGGATGKSAVTVNNSAVLALTGFSNTVGSIASASSLSSITLGSGTLTTGSNNSSTTFEGVISGTGGLTEAGTGTLTLNNANTYSGLTAISAGSNLQLGDGTTNGTIASTSGITDKGTLILDEGSAVTVAANISSTGGITNNGSIQNTLSGTNTYSGATVINGGGLVAGSTSAFGGSGLSAVTINDSGVLSLYGFSNTVGSIASASAASALSLTFGATLTTGGNNTSTTFAGNISGGAGGILTKVGTGTLTLTGANTYTGATNINGGALSVSADNNIGAAPASATANMLNFNGGTLNTTSTFALSSNRGVTLNAGGGTLSPSSGTTLTYGGLVAGTGALTVNGAGTVALTGTNTYTGATNLNGGTLSIGADSALGTAPGSVTLNKLGFNGGTLATTASFALNSNRGMTVNAGGGTISAASGTTLTYGGLIAGTGVLSVPGPGTLNLTNNALNFTGSASVASGELEFSGTLPSIGTLTLGDGSTLYVNGSDLSVSNLVISGNAIIDFGSGASILNSTTFTMDAGAALTVEGWTNEVDYFYAQNWPGATLGTRGVGPETQVTFNGFSSSNTGWLSYDNEISPAPEPAAYGAILVGISLLGVAVYRRKRSAA
ncbi:MAG TPA: autotransporter-associated beta strand repeat-containing protein [Opitutaceae bacterium]|nr:autotransporter-associated beta strand repeat-containing protein [Opitutaceae bacterium]